MTFRPAGLLGFVLCCTFVSTSQPGAQVPTPAPSTPVTFGDLPTLNLRQDWRAEPKSAEEEERARRYDWPSGTPLLSADGKTAEPVFTVRITPDPLPTSASTLIVGGVVKTTTAHLSKSGTALYSTFEFVPDAYFKGSKTLDLPLKLERAGGLAVYPDGQKKFLTAVGFGLPRRNHRYILFLKPTTEGWYRIATGYEVGGGHVVPLDQQGMALSALTPDDLLAKIRAAL